MVITRQEQGFTLIELMIVVVIIAVLAAVAVPSYQEHIARGKRADGKAFLLDLASRQERFYTQYSSYANVIQKPGTCTGAACGLGLSSNSSPEGHYTAAVTLTPSGCSPSGTLCTGFTFTASPTWNDAKCTSLTLTHTASKGTAGPENVDFCWR